MTGTSQQDRDRLALVAEIAVEAAITERWTGIAAFDPRVMEAMAKVPRPHFVPEDEISYAWLNIPLPIGHRQTISQPFIVALMTDLLRPKPDDIVLEVGTGSGYQAAVLSTLVKEVYSIELEPELASAAAERLERLGYDNVTVRAGDGAEGWPPHAPFDSIIVTAGAAEVPPALIEQLRIDGRLVIPVDAGIAQELQVIRKTEDGGIQISDVLPVAFVPLRRT